VNFVLRKKWFVGNFDENLLRGTYFSQTTLNLPEQKTIYGSA